MPSMPSMLCRSSSMGSKVSLPRVALATLCVASLPLGCGSDADVGVGTTAPPGTTSGGSSGSGGTGSSTGGSTGPATAGTAGGSSGGTTGGAMVEVDCNMPPLGAVGASYDHTFLASGGAGSYGWTASGLPDGIVLNPVTGQITGKPAAAGSYDVTVTASFGANPPTEGMAVCTLDIAEAVSVDLGALGKPCVEMGDDVTGLIQGGNGGAITCSTPAGTFPFPLPAGLSVDPDTCAITGTITETRYGTWAWMTRLEQSGAEAWVPYCATQPTPGGYTIRVDHEGLMDAALVPATGVFTPGQPIAYGAAAMDPLFTITGVCNGGSCLYGYVYGVGATPFDAGTLSLSPVQIVKDMNGGPIGFSHELSISGPAVAAALESRPWVFNLDLDYCLTTTGSECSGAMNIQTNGQGKLEFSVIMSPQ